VTLSDSVVHSVEPVGSVPEKWYRFENSFVVPRYVKLFTTFNDGWSLTPRQAYGLQRTSNQRQCVVPEDAPLRPTGDPAPMEAVTLRYRRDCDLSIRWLHGHNPRRGNRQCKRSETLLL
jgi:hypothetical protein